MTLKLGLAGAGYWAALQHAPMHNPSSGTELIGVWAREPDLRERLAKTHDVEPFASFEQMLDECDGVDFAIPPHAQAELATVAARAGKHLLLEKPIAGDLVGARELAAAVRESGVKTVVGVTRRFHTKTEAFIENVRQLRSDGSVLGAQGTFLHEGLLEGGFLEQGTWRSSPSGPLLDLGAHIIDIALAALGPVKSVDARGGRYSTVTLHHAEGAVTQLAVSMHVRAMPSVHSLDVFGTTGVAHYDKTGISDAECWLQICRQLAAAVSEGTPVAADVFTGLQLQEVLDAAIRSMDSGSIQQVSRSDIHSL